MLAKTIQGMYAAIDVLGKVPDWTILMETHARELAIGKLGTFLRVIKFVMTDREDKRGWSFAALKAAPEVEDANRTGIPNKRE
jgi:hypothetical protein